MGAAKQRKQQLEKQIESIEVTAGKISVAIKKLAEAASAQFGGDCYLHAAIGQALLADHGIHAKIVVGDASWRVGQGDGDVITHSPQGRSFTPAGVVGFPYHAWLECEDVLIDFTTYQLRKKAADLDAADGGHTSVEWCPDYLVLPRNKIRSYRDVAKLDAGMAHYEKIEGIDQKITSGFTLDPADIDMARLIMSSPHMRVLGPRNI